MSFTEIIYGLGDFFYATFGIMEKLGNVGNVFFIVVGVVLILTWLKMMSSYNKEAAENGTLK